MALVQKSFSDIITFSRSSNATRVGPTGVLEYAPHNLLLQSETFGTTWTTGNASVTSNAVAAPNGTVTADKLVENTANASHQIVQAVNVTVGVTYTLSMYLKAGERTKFRISPNLQSAGFGYANNDFDLSTGTVISTAANYTSTIQSVGNGWYRCTVTAVAGATTGKDFLCKLLDASGNDSYTGDGTSGLFLWGAQWAVGPYALDYTPTTSAAVYGPRFDYDGSGVTIVEPVSRNLLTYSQEFDNAAWTKSGVAITANATTSPDGTVNAALIASDSAAAPLAHQAYQIGKSLSASTAYTASIYAKANTLSWLAINLYDTVGLNVYAYFNLSTGVVGTVQGGGSATITALANGWFRCTFTRTLSSTSSSGGLSIEITNADNSIPGTLGPSLAVGTGIYIWGAQLEVGSTATAYMVSGATNGFRAVPVVSGSATARGLLVEEQRTNLLTYSEDYSNAAWTKSGSTVTANAVASPDGTVTADKLAEDSSAGYHQIYQTSSVTSGASYTFSVYAKAAERTKLSVFVQVTGATAVTFNLSAGSYVIDSGSVTATITSVGNGWYRCSVTATATATGTGYFNVLLNNGSTSSYTGDGTSGAYVWGAQLEAGSFATSYIPTLASTVTRSADLASVDTLTPWMNQTEGTIFAEYLFYGADAAYNNTAVMLTDGTENNYETIFGYNPAYGWVQSGGATSAGLSSGGSTTINTNYKAALAFKANDFAFSLNGGAAVTDTSGSVPTVTQMLLGRRVSNSKPLHGYLRRVAFFPRRLSNAEIQALTA